MNDRRASTNDTIFPIDMWLMQMTPIVIINGVKAKYVLNLDYYITNVPTSETDHTTTVF